MYHHLKYTLLALLALLSFGACQPDYPVSESPHADLFRQYASQEGIRMAFIEKMQIDSTLSLDVTVISARDTAGWQWMCTTFDIVVPPPEILALLDEDNTFGVRLVDPRQPAIKVDIAHPGCNLLVIAPVEHAVYLFHTDTREQIDHIFKQKINELNK